MIKTIKSDRVNRLVSKIINSKKLEELDPVIAGGSILSVYLSVTLYDTDDRWKYFERRVERNPKTSGMPVFGDVDCWFLKGHKIHSSNDENNPLIGDISPPTANSVAVPLSGRDYFSPTLGALGVSRASRWANTFRMAPNVFGVGQYQFIKAEPESPESLISSFDFINSMAAWKSGVLYYDDRIDSAFKDLQLQMNDDKAYGGSIASRIFNALRAFKYSMRYSLDFDPGLCDHVFKVYSEIGGIDYDSYADKVVELENLYGKSISSVDALKEMVATLKGRFEEFALMNTFKPEYALFLLKDSDSIPGLKDYIARNGRPKQSNPPYVLNGGIVWPGSSLVAAIK